MIIFLILLFILLMVSLVVFVLAFYNSNKKDVTYDVLRGADYDCYHDRMIEIIKKAAEIPYEEVYIKSHDGYMLFGRLYLKDEDAPVHIQFHGYRGNGLRDFSGGLQLALEMGGNVIVVDQRAHGKSEGHIISFGIKERYDVQSWINYVQNRFGEHTSVFLEGISMGAATVLMASNLNLPDSVKGIIADCPYSAPLEIIRQTASGLMPCSKVLNPFIVIAAFLFGRFNIFECSAVKSVTETKVPVLLIHGTGDHFVPVEMGRTIYNANPAQITKIEVDGAPHGLSYIKDYKLYETAFKYFVEQNA